MSLLRVQCGVDLDLKGSLLPVWAWPVQIKPWRDQSGRGGTCIHRALESIQVDIWSTRSLNPNPSRTAVRRVEPCVRPPLLRTIALQSAKQPIIRNLHLLHLLTFRQRFWLPNRAPSCNWVQNSLIAFQRRTKVVCCLTAAQTSVCVYLLWIQTLK